MFIGPSCFIQKKASPKRSVSNQITCSFKDSVCEQHPIQYRDAGKSLHRPARKEANVSVTKA